MKLPARVRQPSMASAKPETAETPAGTLSTGLAAAT